MTPSVVIIEDDLELQKYLRRVLSDHGFSVKLASTGIAGMELVTKMAPDIVLLDLTLPDIEGEGVCHEIRASYPELPIIMLTARDAVSDKVRGLTSGADDYITKPFNVDELVARIQTRLRHSADNNSVIKIADLEMDLKKIEVRRGGKIISLTPQEFKLLEYLMINSGTVLSRDMILNRIWLFSPEIETRVVDVYIGYLRKKIDSGNSHKLIHSIRGFGYTVKD